MRAGFYAQRYAVIANHLDFCIVGDVPVALANGDSIGQAPFDTAHKRVVNVDCPGEGAHRTVVVEFDESCGNDPVAVATGRGGRFRGSCRVDRSPVDVDGDIVALVAGASHNAQGEQGDEECCGC